MWGKTKALERGFLRALFFDDQWVGQGGQLCQLKNGSGFKGFPAGGFHWLASGAVASTNWIPWIPQRIQHAEVAIRQVFDNESLFPESYGSWIPGGFPGESAFR